MSYYYIILLWQLSIKTTCCFSFSVGYPNILLPPPPPNTELLPPTWSHTSKPICFWTVVCSPKRDCVIKLKLNAKGLPPPPAQSWETLLEKANFRLHIYFYILLLLLWLLMFSILVTCVFGHISAGVSSSARLLQRRRCVRREESEPASLPKRMEEV